MAFYIRKSIRAGPIRLNVSKRGLGLSSGVKGLRVGSGSRGNYVHGGRYGLYYRQSLKGKKVGRVQRSSPNIEEILKAVLVIISIIIAAWVVLSIVAWFGENPLVFFSLVGT